MEPAPACTTASPTACLLHGDFHVMDRECWEVTTDWYFDHQHIPSAEQHDDYMAAVERKILDAFTRGGTL